MQKALTILTTVVMMIVIAPIALQVVFYLLLPVAQLMLILAIPILPVLLIALPIWIVAGAIDWAYGKIQAARHR